MRRGNNAGDGFILARLAKSSGLTVHVHALANPDEYQGDALTACEKLFSSRG